MKNRRYIYLVMILGLLLSGCQGSYINTAEEENVPLLIEEQVDVTADTIPSEKVLLEKTQMTEEELALDEARLLNGINIMYPPAPLAACDSDGVTDVTKELQAIVDYCAANKKALIIPEDKIFRISQIIMENMYGFTLYGFGTLKRIDNATDPQSMVHFVNSDHINIPILHTDGNVDNNLGGGDGEPIRVQEDAHSLRIRSCDGVTIGEVYDINPVGDGIYLNGTDNLYAELISSTADVDCGRNGLSIINGNTMEIETVISTNIGVAGMPGGLDLEPNTNDEIRNVTIHNAIIHSIATGFQVSANDETRVIDNVNITAHVTRTHSDDNKSSFANIFQGVTNSVFDVTTVQNKVSDGPVLIRCDNIDLNMNISNCDRGVLILDTHNFNITGSISDTDQGSVHFDAYNAGDTSSNGVIDMTLKNSDRYNGGKYGAVYNIWKSTLNNITFKGDYAKDVTGANVIRNEGIMINCILEDLDVSGFSSEDVVTGFGSTDLRD